MVVIYMGRRKNGAGEVPLIAGQHSKGVGVGLLWMSTLHIGQVFSLGENMVSFVMLDSCIGWITL